MYQFFFRCFLVCFVGANKMIGVDGCGCTTVNGWSLFCMYTFYMPIEVNNLLILFGHVLVFCLGTCVSWWMFFVVQ